MPQRRATASTDIGLHDLQRVRRAVVVVDVVESVRLMQADADGFIERWRRLVAEVRGSVLPPQGGRLVKSLGDGLLLEFKTAPAAAAAMLDLLRRLPAHNGGCTPATRICLRLGANVADIVVDELDIYGPGINSAARVATLAGPDQIVVTAEFADELVAGIDAELEDLGDNYLKHLDAPLRCHRLHEPGTLPAAARELAAPPLAAQADSLVPRLAVMPLAAVGLSGDDAVAGHLVADNLASRLARAGALRVISRLSTNALAGRAITAPEVARRLDAQFVVAGNLLGRGAQRWRIHLELIDGRDGTLLWTGADDVSPDALVQPDDEVSADFAARLLQAITAHQMQRLHTHTLPSLQSFALQMAGLRLMHQASREAFDRGREVLEALVERHPRVPTPRAWLSLWWVLRTTRGLAAAPQAEAAQALTHVRAALQAEPDNALALATRGFVETHLLHDLDAAEQTLELALQANANEPLAWLYRSVVHAFRGEGEAAYRAAETAQSLSPLDPQRHYFDALTASAAITAGALPRGIELARRALRANRNHLPTLRALTVALSESGDLDGARATARRVLELAPEFTIRQYVADAPKGSEATRQRFAQSFALAGLPAG